MRESGPVSKVLGADAGDDNGAAQPYIGAARNQLGTLKNQMRYNGLDQGALTRRLPDGTVIRVTSILGQDKINIAAATPAVPAPEQPEPPKHELPPEPEWQPEDIRTTLETTAFAACGYASFFRPGYSTPNTKAWVWKPGDAAVTEIPGPSGARSWWALAISGNGRVVVGAWIGQDDVQRAFRWSAGAGAQDLGAPYEGPDAPVCAATGVNFDGSVVVGSGPKAADAQHCCNWVWTSGGMVILAGSGCNHSGGQASRVKVSPNGKYIFGTVQERMLTGYSAQGGTGGGTTPVVHWEPTYSDEGRGAVWTGAGGAYGGAQLLPYSGLELVGIADATISGLTPIMWTEPIAIGPGNIADNGTVCGNGPFALRCTLAGEIIFITDPGATVVGPPSTNNTVVYGPNGESSTAVGITASSARVAGTGASGPFVWTNGALVPIPSPVGGSLNDMSRDGTSFIGITDYVSGQNTEALYWAKGRQTVIPHMDGAMDMIGTGVASANLRIPPIPPKPLPVGLE